MDSDVPKLKKSNSRSKSDHNVPKLKPRTNLKWMIISLN